jgi:hypothetical protein
MVLGESALHCSLLAQLSRTACVPGRTFGCSHELIWAADGCRGRFQCSGGKKLSCGDWKGWAPNESCRCASG